MANIKKTAKKVVPASKKSSGGAVKAKSARAAKPAKAAKATKPSAKAAPKKAAPAPKPAEVVPETYTSVILTAPEATELLRKSVQDGNMKNFYQSLVMGADINSVDKDSKSVLLLSVMAQNKEMTEVLIYKGAALNVKSKGGNTPLSMARDLGAKDIEQMLLKAGAKE